MNCRMLSSNTSLFLETSVTSPAKWVWEQSSGFLTLPATTVQNTSAPVNPSWALHPLSGTVHQVTSTKSDQSLPLLPISSVRSHGNVLGHKLWVHSPSLVALLTVPFHLHTGTIRGNLSALLRVISPESNRGSGMREPSKQGWLGEGIVSVNN